LAFTLSLCCCNIHCDNNHIQLKLPANRLPSTSIVILIPYADLEKILLAYQQDMAACMRHDSASHASKQQFLCFCPPLVPITIKSVRCCFLAYSIMALGTDGTSITILLVIRAFASSFLAISSTSSVHFLACFSA
jgi:hypothetical protein